MKRKKAYIYTRVSTNMQVEGFSLDLKKQEFSNMQMLLILRL